MRTYSPTELFTFTRDELFSLHARIVADLASLPAEQRAVALDNLRAIRRVLGHPRYAPS